MVTTPSHPASAKKGPRAVLFTLAAIGLVGFIVELIRDPILEGYVTSPRAAADEKLLPAPTYLGWRTLDRSSNEERYIKTFGKIVSDKPKLVGLVAPTAAERELALKERSESRAYDGAPPTIPHPTDQRGYPGCLACHETGALIGDQALKANPMSHGVIANCLQCHVVQEGTAPGQRMEASVATENSFAGLAPNASVEPQLMGSPPPIPHRTLMRDRCDSCHGGYAEGLRTNHPYRQNCQQCHSAFAETLEQRPVVSLQKPVDSGSADSGSADSGSADSGSADSGSADSRSAAGGGQPSQSN